MAIYAHPLTRSLNGTLNATGAIHRLVTELGTDAMPLPDTVTPTERAILRYQAAALQGMLRSVNGRIEAALPKRSTAA